MWLLLTHFYMASTTRVTLDAVEMVMEEDMVAIVPKKSECITRCRHHIADRTFRSVHVHTSSLKAWMKKMMQTLV